MLYVDKHTICDSNGNGSIMMNLTMSVIKRDRVSVCVFVRERECVCL